VTSVTWFSCCQQAIPRKNPRLRSLDGRGRTSLYSLLSSPPQRFVFCWRKRNSRSIETGVADVCLGFYFCSGSGGRIESEGSAYHS
jgi:hypothetical protein